MFTKLSLKKLVDQPVPGDKKPSHALVAADDGYQNKVVVGKMWMKSSQYGNFLSGGLNEETRTWTDKEGNQRTDEAYVIITRKEYDELIALKTPVTPKGMEDLEF